MKTRSLLLFLLGLSFQAWSQLGTPSLTAPSNGSTWYVGSTLNFSWTTVAGATSYDLEFDAGLGWTFTTTVTGTSYSVPLTSASAGSHTWHVRGKNDVATGSWSSSFTYNVVDIPGVPVLSSPNADALITYGTDTRFSWGSVTGATSYKIKFDSDAPVTVSSTSYQTLFTVTGTHSWSVQAVNNAGSSAWSSPRYFTVVLATPTLSAPANGATFFTGSSVDFTWSPVAGVISYDIEFDAGLGYAKLVNLTGTTYNLPLTLQLIGNHTWHVRARDASTAYTWSSSRTFSVVGPPAVLSLYNPANGSQVAYDGLTTFSWSNVQTATKYQIQFDSEAPIDVSGSASYQRAFTVFGDHTWKVRAVNDAGSSDWSTQRFFTVILGVPNLTAPNNNFLSYYGIALKFSWSQVVGATSYDIEFDNGLGISNLFNITTSSYTWTPVQDDIGSHNWHVRARSGSIIGPWSSTRTVLIAGLPAIPVLGNPPNGVTIQNDVNTTFSWNNALYATGYLIQFDNETPIPVTGNFYSRSFSILGDHTWRVKSTNGLGESDWSTARSFTVSMGTPNLTAPANNATFYVGDVVNFTWSTVLGATSYDIEFDAGLGITTTFNVTKTGYSQTMTALQVGPHSCHVRARINSQLGPWSSSRSYQIVGIPPAPTLVSPPSGATFAPGTLISFTWMASNRATSYKIQFDNEAPVLVSGSTSYTRSYTTPGDHTWKVLASNGAGDSDWSDTRNFSIVLATPTLTAPANGTVVYLASSVDFTWTSVLGASSYDVEFDAGTGRVTLLNVATNSLKQLMDGSDPGPHTWHVRARYGTLTGNWSSSWNFVVYGIPGVPNLVNPPAGYKGTFMADINFSWSSVLFATSYKVQFDNDAPITVTGTSYTRSFSTTGSHSWKVLASNDAGDGSWSSSSAFTVDYGVPVLRSPDDAASLYLGTTVSFAWSTVPGAVSYDIEFDAGTAQSILVNLSSTSFSKLIDAGYSGQHTWHVRALFTGATGAWSASRTLGVFGVPAVPTLISPTNEASLPYSQPVVFTWNAVPGASGYLIQIDNDTPVSVSALTYSRSFSNLDKHTWKVRATNPAGMSDYSETRNFTIVLGTPTLTAPVTGTTVNQGNTVEFTWSAVQGAASYDVEFDAGTTRVTLTNVTTNSLKQLMGAVDAGSRTWHVRARNGNYTGNWSVSWTFQVIGLPPAPTLITPDNGYKGLYGADISFAWNGVPSANGYKIQFDNEAPVTVSGTSYIRTFTTTGSHSWKVLATNQAGDSGWSAVFTFTIEYGIPVLKSPDDGAVIYVGSSINFSWSAVPGAVSYDIETDAGTAQSALTNVKETAFSKIATANFTGQHTWRVRAVFGSASGSWSSDRTLKVVGIPETPALILPVNGSSLSFAEPVTFTWNASTGATSYSIQVDNDTPVIVTAATYTRTFTTLGKHTWKVLASNPAGSSSLSTVNEFTLAIGGPTIISPANGASLYTGTTLVYSWTSIPGATSYDLEIDPGTPSAVLINLSGTTYSYLLAGKDAGPHNWHVRANFSTVAGTWSASYAYTVTGIPAVPVLTAPAADAVIYVGSATDFTWNSVPGATVYKIQIDGEPAVEVTGTTFTKTFPATGVHTWKVMAANPAGNSSWSTPRNFTVSIGTPVPTAPASGTKILVGRTATFSWTAVPGATSYDVEFDPGTPGASIKNITGASFDYLALQANAGLHTWRVRANQASVSGQWSPGQAYEIIGVPDAPVLISPDNGSIAYRLSPVDFTWKALQGVTDYKIQIDDEAPVAVTGTSYTRTYSTAGTHSWKVMAVNIAGEGPWSTSWTFIVLNSTISESKSLYVQPEKSWDFGTVSVDNPVTKSFVLQNKGNATVSITGLSITGAAADQFSIISKTGSQFGITPGGQEQVTIMFKPSSAGVKTAFLTIANNADNASPSIVISLTGNGSLQPTKTLSVEPEGTWDFGWLTVINGAEKVFTLRNTGTTALSVSALAISGSQADQFKIISPATGSFDIAAGGSEQVTISFRPTSAGVKNGIFTITSNADNTPSKSVNLTGTGSLLDTRTLQVSPADFIDFGEMTINSSLEKVLTLQNTGTATVSVTALTISGAQANQFTVSSSAVLPMDIPAGGFQQVILKFKPASQGLSNAILTIGSNADNGTSRSVTLSGTGTTLPVKLLSINPDGFYDFGNIVLNNAAEKTFILQNQGTVAVTISSVAVTGPNAALFVITNPANTSFSIPAGGLSQVTVRFDAASPGLKLGYLTVASNADNTAATKIVSMNGNVLAQLSLSVPTVVGYPVTGVTMTEAVSGGIVTADGGSPVTAKGVCWSLNANPTIQDNKTTDGSGMNAFNSKISGLKTGTTYHVRAYATNAVGTGYGAEYVIKTLGLAEVQTLTAEAKSSTEITAGGNVLSDGGAEVTARGICWGKNLNPGILDARTLEGGGTGTFSSTISGLMPGTTYHVRAYATNVTGTTYGADVVVNTPDKPTVNTGMVTIRSSVEVSGGGTVVSDGGAAVTARGLCWSSTANPTISNSKTTDGSGTGSFTTTLTGLTPGTTYHVRAYATNAVGTSYGNDVQFMTPTLPMVVTLSAAPMNEVSTQAIAKGNVTSDGGAAVTVKGLCWSTLAGPTTADSKTSDGSGTGSFNDILTGLTPGTIYRIRAYATNMVGTSYGEEMTFRTSVNNGVFSIDGSWHIYPNPTYGRVTVLSAKDMPYDMEIYSLSGELINTLKMNSQVSSLDLRMRRGTYLVVFRRDNQKSVSRLVIL